MYSNNDALAPTLYVLGAVVFVGLTLWQCSANHSGENQSTAKSTAAHYAKELGIEVRALTCAKMDSDGDGYVSCTIMPTEGPPMMVECTGAWTYNEGCRLPKANIHR
jgi:hypothetical protein